MSSSTTTSGLSRTRSLRQPTSSRNLESKASAIPTTGDGNDATGSHGLARGVGSLPVRSQSTRIASPTKLRTPGTVTVAQPSTSRDNDAHSNGPSASRRLPPALVAAPTRSAGASTPGLNKKAPHTVPAQATHVPSSKIHQQRTQVLASQTTSVGSGPRLRSQTQSKVPSGLSHARTKSSGIPPAQALVVNTALTAATSQPASVHSTTSSTATTATSQMAPPTRPNSTTTMQSLATSRSHKSQASPTSLSDFSSLGGRGHAHHHSGPAAISSKPAFSTLQQHYSPAKSLAPKPSTASILAPPTPSKLPANVQATSEVARLQSELLQLHLLHRNAAQVSAEWHASARSKLQVRFDASIKDTAKVAAAEKMIIEWNNMRALRDWLIASPPPLLPSSNSRSGTSGVRSTVTGGLVGRPSTATAVAVLEQPAAQSSGYQLAEEKIQALDEVVSGLWAMGEAGGRFSRIVRRFDRWLARAQKAMEMRRSTRDHVQCAKGGTSALEFVAALVASSGNNSTNITNTIISNARDENESEGYDDAASERQHVDAGCGGSGSRGEEGMLLFAGSLEPDWKEDCAALARQLLEWRRLLNNVGTVVRTKEEEEEEEEEEEKEGQETHNYRKTDGEKGFNCQSSLKRNNHGDACCKGQDDGEWGTDSESGDDSHDHHQLQVRDLTVSKAVVGVGTHTPAARSALAKMLDGCGGMVRDTLAELEAMESIERSSVMAENDWVRSVNAEHDVEIDSSTTAAVGVDSARRRAGAIWRLV